MLTCTTNVGLSYYGYGCLGVTLSILLAIDFAVAEHLADHFGWKGIHTTYTYTVQTAWHFVRAFIELTTSVEHGHYHFEGGTVFLGVHVDRNTTTIVLYNDRVVRTDGYFDVCTIPRKGFVNGVVDGLVHQVVQTFFTDVANVHSGTLTYCFQAFKHLNITGTISGCAFVFYFFHIGF